MSEVTVREFSRNPSAFFALAEQGESMTITKRGMPIAIVSPTTGELGKYAKLVAEGRLRLARFTSSDIDKFPHYEMEGDPVQDLIDAREQEHQERTAPFRRIMGSPVDRDLS